MKVRRPSPLFYFFFLGGGVVVEKMQAHLENFPWYSQGRSILSVGVPCQEGTNQVQGKDLAGPGLFRKT